MSVGKKKWPRISEKSLGAPSNMTYSLNNIVPTPIRVHTQISAVHSSNALPGQTLRVYIKSLQPGKPGGIPWERVYEAEAQIWQKAMNLNGKPMRVEEAKDIIDMFI